jgi:hypothetical protein
MITRKMWAVIEDNQIKNIYSTRKGAEAMLQIFYCNAKIKRCEVKVL